MYPKLAELFGGTPSSVERTIRHALETSFKRCPQNVQVAYFGKGAENGKVKNKTAIAKLFEKLADRLGECSIKEAEVAVDDDNKLVKSEIQSLLNEIGISKTVLGYEYIAEAVYIIYKQPHKAKSFEKYIYPEIAHAQITAPRNIMRGMRYASLSAQKRFPDMEFWRWFDENDVAVTPKKVICRIIEML